jgi:hypothetical protein
MSGNFNIIMNIPWNSNGSPIWSTPTGIPGTSSNRMVAITVSSSERFVAVGYTTGVSADRPLAAYSNDGITWSTPASMNGTTTYGIMSAVTINSSGRFVAVGLGPGNVSVSAYSDDGITWSTPAAVGGAAYNSHMYGVAVNSSGRFVAVGGDLTLNGSIATSYSDDGITWSAPALMNGYTPGSRMLAVTVNSSGRFVAVGWSQNPSLQYSFVSYSDNGTTWSNPTVITGSLSGTSMKGITINSSGRFVAVGDNTSSGFASSLDGINWSVPTAMYGSLASIDGITVNSSGRFVAVGNDGTTGLVIFPYSIT